MADPAYVTLLDVNFNNNPKRVIILEEATLRAALQDDGGVFTDDTTDATDVGTGDVLFFPATEAVNDAFYIGSHAAFKRVSITISTAGVGGLVAWEYWNGTAWVALPGLVDGTTNFTIAPGVGLVTFDLPQDWATTTLDPGGLDSGPFFFIRARLTQVYGTNPVGSLVQLGEDIGDRPVKYMLWDGLLVGDQAQIAALVTAHGTGGTTLPLVNGLLDTKEFTLTTNGTSFFDTYRMSIKTLGVKPDMAAGGQHFYSTSVYYDDVSDNRWEHLIDDTVVP